MDYQIGYANEFSSTEIRNFKRIVIEAGEVIITEPLPWRSSIISIRVILDIPVILTPHQDD